ncbi:MAG: peptidyl-tRNA hydrolase [Pirellulaceae bacterium]|nr:MAG: peptidyl-tRNA hydrolase [Pirellulaceae bacterium]
MESSDSLKLVVGLGNPGPKYRGTRHNVGFDVLDCIAERFSAGVPQSKFEGQLASVTIGASRVLLAWPLTYMNHSGRCVAAIARFYKIDVEKDLLVICDDLSLPLGKLRMRASGSAGGQKGLADILRALGTQSIPRLRVGIGSPPPQWDAADYVLGSFSPAEREQIQSAVARASDAVEAWVARGIAFTMNHYN